MAASDPPSPQLLATLHYLQDACNYGRSYPATSSEGVRLVAYFLKRLIDWPAAWPLPQIAGLPGVAPPLEDVAGVTSIRADVSPFLTGAVTLASGTNVTLTQVGQTITVDASFTPTSPILFDQTLGADAASIDTGANGIAQTQNVLVVYIIARTSQAVGLSSVNVTVNNDTGANYDRMVLSGTNVTAAAGTGGGAVTSWTMAVAGDSVQAGSFSAIHGHIPGYLQTTAHKMMIAHAGVSDSVAANNRIESDAFRWRSTAAISRMKVAAGSGNLRAGSRLLILGW